MKPSESKESRLNYIANQKRFGYAYYMKELEKNSIILNELKPIICNYLRGIKYQCDSCPDVFYLDSFDYDALENVVSKNVFSFLKQNSCKYKKKYNGIIGVSRITNKLIMVCDNADCVAFINSIVYNSQTESVCKNLESYEIRHISYIFMCVFFFFFFFF